MKKYFLISLGILFLSLYSVSALYVGEINANVGENVVVTVGDNPVVNVNDSTNNPNNGGNSNPSGGGGGGGSSFLSSVIKSVFNDEENETENLNTNEENENPEEKTTSNNFLTGFAVGISDFAKSPAGIATFIIVGLFVVGGVTFLVVKKGKFPKIFKKKEENSIAEQ